MATDRFLIAPYNSGWENDLEPFLLPDDAFVSLRNAYIYRGKIRKRFGARLLNENNITPQLTSRLRIALPGGKGVGITDPAGDATGIIPGANFASLGKLFSIYDPVLGEDILYTVYQVGAPANMLISDLVGTATYNTVTGAYAFTGVPGNTQIYFYPADPVMGLLTAETEAINDDRLIAFDPQFAYERSAGFWARLATETVPGDSVWTGTDAQFFWGTTWQGANVGDRIFFVVNFNEADRIRYFNLATNTWSEITYIVNGANELRSAKIIALFKNRLIVLNTKELTGAASVSYPNRCRYSQIGDPVAAATSFLEVPGRGGYIDCPSKESIASAQIVKDRLIVFFERSTWELAYTGNQVKPFVWQKIDSELGCESTFSTVLFDSDIVGVGNVGIHACNGAYVQRIDQKIPDEVFKIHNNNAGVDRVYGIRDYQAQCIYWTFPSQYNSPTYPNRVMVFNYVNKSWALNDDTITCFGYYQPSTTLTWADIKWPWSAWKIPWNSGSVQALSRTVVAGNQEGYTFVVDIDIAKNCPALQITNLTKPADVQLQIMKHNLTIDDYIYIENCIGSTTCNGKIYQVNSVVDANNITIIEPLFAGLYSGGGTVTRVSKIDILTKEYNFYLSQGRNCIVNRIDFLVDATAHGEIQVDTLPSSGVLAVESKKLETFPYDFIYPYELYQERLVHQVYTDATGFGLQFHIYLTNSQMINKDIAFEDFQVHGILFRAQPS